MRLWDIWVYQTFGHHQVYGNADAYDVKVMIIGYIKIKNKVTKQKGLKH